MFKVYSAQVTFSIVIGFQSCSGAVFVTKIDVCLSSSFTVPNLFFIFPADGTALMSIRFTNS